MENAGNEQPMLPLGLVKLKTAPDKDREELLADLDNTISEMKGQMPGLAGFFVFGVDKDRSYFSYLNVTRQSPHPELLWPDFVQRACWLDAMTGEVPND